MCYEMKKVSVRDVNLDLIRVIAMIFVIMIHIPVVPFQKDTLIYQMFRSLFLVCNCLFFMLSGYFNLSYEFHNKNDYKIYYFKKFLSVFFPFLFLSFLIFLWDFYVIPHKKFSYLLFWQFYQYFMGDKISVHLWFMYPLIGFLISAPFIGKMLQRLSNWELNLLFTIAIMWNIISIYFGSNLGTDFLYSGWLLSGWMFTFFAGYYCKRIIHENNKNKFYFMGILGFCGTVLGNYFFSEHFYHANDFSILFIFFSIAIFVFIKNEIKIKRSFVKKIIHFLAKYSFLVYLYHWNILLDIVMKIVGNSSSVFHFLLTSFLTLVISLIFSIATDLLVLRPIKYLFVKKIYSME